MSTHLVPAESFRAEPSAAPAIALAEYLPRIELLAPIGDLVLAADDVVPLEERSASMLQDAKNDGESLALVLGRVAARLGPEHVLRPVLVEDHRVE